jgi:hypothetical protein
LPSWSSKDDRQSVRLMPWLPGNTTTYSWSTLRAVLRVDVGAARASSWHAGLDDATGADDQVDGRQPFGQQAPAPKRWWAPNRGSETCRVVTQSLLSPPVLRRPADTISATPREDSDAVHRHRR